MIKTHFQVDICMVKVLALIFACDLPLQVCSLQLVVCVKHGFEVHLATRRTHAA